MYGEREILTWSNVIDAAAVYYIAHWIQNDYEKERDDCLYILMESCDCSLKDLIRDWSKIFPKPDNQAILVLEYVILSLVYLRLLHNVDRIHSFAIIHRDLKPANILIKSRTKIANKSYQWSSLRLGDFGLAQFHKLHHGADQNIYGSIGSYTQVLGTPNYIAPEVKSGHYSRKADIDSLDVIRKDLFGYSIELLKITLFNCYNIQSKYLHS